MKNHTTPSQPAPDPLDDRAKDQTYNWPRLFYDEPINTLNVIALSQDQAHYLQHVLRRQPGDFVRIFNGKDGDWKGVIHSFTKKAALIELSALLRPQTPEPDLWLCCAPIKKQHFDLVLTKATELGVSSIRPILSARTQIRDFNLIRGHLLVTEAAEQSERLTIPEVCAPTALVQTLKSWPADRPALFCAESGEARPINETLTTYLLDYTKKAALFIGPEGGFTQDELELMRNTPGFRSVRLGPRILRADTAALAALSCWQAVCGDWR